MDKSRRKIIEELSGCITERRGELFDRVLDFRARYITVVLEDIYQSHNASAVLRTCECFGIQDVHIIENRNTYNINPDVVLGATGLLPQHWMKRLFRCTILIFIQGNAPSFSGQSLPVWWIRCWTRRMNSWRSPYLDLPGASISRFQQQSYWINWPWDFISLIFPGGYRRQKERYNGWIGLINRSGEGNGLNLTEIVVTRKIVRKEYPFAIFSV